jgi:cytochrome c-type biogenesis protein CcmH/NrfG
MRKGAFIPAVLAPLVLSLVPGWGHIWLHRPVRGMTLFLLVFGALNLALLMGLGIRVDLPRGLFHPVLAAAAGIYVYSVVDVARLALWTASRSAQAKRQTLFKKVVAHYLKGEHGQAEEAVRGMLRIDPQDTSALVYLGMIHGARGRRGKAIATLKRARRLHSDETTAKDIERELRRLKEGKSP